MKYNHRMAMQLTVNVFDLRIKKHLKKALIYL